MRILSKLPVAPEGWSIMSSCTFCDEMTRDFLILESPDIDSLALICIKCITKIVDAASERWGVDSQA